MRPVIHSEVEILLKRDARSQLPLARQILIYLDPFALFKDASSGPVRARESARSYNRAMRWMLVAYMRRWLAIALTLALLLAPAEAAAAQQAMFAIPTAAIAVGCCIALTVVAVTGAVYLLLGKGDQP